MQGEIDAGRCLIAVTGSERVKFLQGLVTRDAVAGELVYSALLTAQGKFMVDFFLLQRADDILIDVKADQTPMLAQRLSMYKLRADVALAEADLSVTRGLGEVPEGAYADPRHPALGWRGYGLEGGAPEIDWNAIRVEHCIPEMGVELQANDGYILEAGFERLSGVDHRKGCYVGQEVTARMKHKTTLRKGLVVVDIEGEAPVGSDIMAGDRPAGTLFTQSSGRAIAHLRYDRAKGEMQAGEARVTWSGEFPE